MYKLRATLIKDIRILSRDKVGLTFMFLMPVILVIVITSLQAGTYELVNENKMELVICNRDKGELGKQFVQALSKAGLSAITDIPAHFSDEQVANEMHKKDALIAIDIPADFSLKLTEKANSIASKALSDISTDSAQTNFVLGESVKLYYNPVLQQSYLKSINGALLSALELVQGKQILNTIYSSLNDSKLPASLEQEILDSKINIDEIPVSKSGNKNVPNATQHNIPAWTIFAMFFVVTSLGSGVVREKLSGSFIRLKTLPTNYLLSLFSKQITYVGVCLVQVMVIFSLGVWLFPIIGLPALHIPANGIGLLLISLLSGWCAVSYAICIGVYAKSQEQANGFGAVSIVILAALGGVLVPGFAMPDSFRILMQLSPLHWCLEAYYELFLEDGSFTDILRTILPILFITIAIQLLIFFKLKRIQII